MRCRSSWAIFTSSLVLAGCEARISGAPGDDPGITNRPDASEPLDAQLPPIDSPVPLDAPVVLGAWGNANKVSAASLNNQEEDDGSLTSDGLEMVFSRQGQNGKDLYYTSRTSLTAEWSAATPLTTLNTNNSDETPRFSADDLTLYFSSSRNGTLDIYSATRAAKGTSTFPAPQPLAGVNTTANVEKWFMPCTGGRYVMIQNPSGQNDGDLVEGVLNSGVAPAPITILNGAADNELSPFLTQDCLTIFFASDRSGTVLLYTARRESVTSPWLAPSLVTFPIAGGNGNNATQEDPWMSPDQRIFAFSSNKDGTRDVYISTR